jgi:hypothetical protein
MFLLQPLPIKHSRTKKHPLANAIKKIRTNWQKTKAKKENLYKNLQKYLQKNFNEKLKEKNQVNRYSLYQRWNCS